MTQAAPSEDPQRSFEEEELEDDGLLANLNEWKAASDELATAKEAAKPYTKTVDDAGEARDDARAAVNARLKTMEIEVVGTDNVYRCGTYTLKNKHRDSSNRGFTVKAKDELKIEAAS